MKMGKETASTNTDSMNQGDINNLTGFQDLYPDRWSRRRRLVEVWRRVSRQWGMEEYEGPTLEPTELYTRKSGPEIVEQLFSTQLEDPQASMRPEITPTLARMVGKRRRGLKKPVRWFSIPTLFRRETPQRGRLREFLQWNVDILGTDRLEADVEVATLCLEALRQLGLQAQDVVMKVSSRPLLENLLNQIGVDEEKMTPCLQVLDKLDRRDPEWILEELADLGLDAASIREAMNVGQLQDLSVLQQKASTDQAQKQVERLQAFFRQMDQAGYGDYVELDMSVVRGLDYYTGLVFEVFDRQYDLRALCGGGRFDNLLSQISDEDMPAVGFGMGDAVLLEALQERNLLDDYQRELDYYIISITDQQREGVRKLAGKLRQGGQKVAFDLRDRNVGKQFGEADQMGARQAIIIGPDEQEKGEVTIRDMQTGEQTTQPIEMLLQAHQHETGEYPGIETFDPQETAEILAFSKELTLENLWVRARQGHVRSSRLKEANLWLYTNNPKDVKQQRFEWGFLEHDGQRWLLEQPALENGKGTFIIECRQMERVGHGLSVDRKTLLTLRNNQEGQLQPDTWLEGQKEGRLFSSGTRLENVEQLHVPTRTLFWWDRTRLVVLGKDALDITEQYPECNLSNQAQEIIDQRQPDQIFRVG